MVSRYTLTFQNQLCFYLLANKKLENAIKNGKNTIHNLTKEGQTVYFENDKTLLKGIKGQNKCTDSSCFWIR